MCAEVCHNAIVCYTVLVHDVPILKICIYSQYTHIIIVNVLFSSFLRLPTPKTPWNQKMICPSDPGPRSLRCCLMELQDLRPHGARHWRWISAMCHASCSLDARNLIRKTSQLWFEKCELAILALQTTSNYKMILNKAWASRTCFWQWLLVVKSWLACGKLVASSWSHGVGCAQVPWDYHETMG